MAAPHWLALFALILAGWTLLYAMAVPADLRAASRLFGADLWASLCAVTPDRAGLAGLAAMWALMSAAMMLPTFLPALATYDDFRRGGRATSTGFALLVSGYLVLWIGFSVLAAAAQLALSGAGLLSPVGQSLSPVLSALLLTLAGAYQFSPLKAACLTQCREPLSFFMQHWRATALNPLAMGVRLGAVCIGCCWALMLLGFVGGVMNLAFMGLATLIMIVEKLPAIGRYVTKPLGVALITLGIATLAGLLTGIL